MPTGLILYNYIRTSKESFDTTTDNKLTCMYSEVYKGFTKCNTQYPNVQANLKTPDIIRLVSTNAKSPDTNTCSEEACPYLPTGKWVYTSQV